MVLNYLTNTLVINIGDNISKNTILIFQQLKNPL